MSNTPKTFYLGAALNKASAEFRTLTERIRLEISQTYGIEALEFLGDRRPPGVSVYQYDIELALQADYGIFLCDHPSIGMGVEIYARHVEEKPIILCAQDPKAQSALLFDFAADHQYPYLAYTAPSDLVAKLAPFIT